MTMTCFHLQTKVRPDSPAELTKEGCILEPLDDFGSYLHFGPRGMGAVPVLVPIRVYHCVFCDRVYEVEDERHPLRLHRDYLFSESV